MDGSVIFASWRAHVHSALHLTHAFLDPLESIPQMAPRSIGSAVFARLTIVTDRPTDRPTDHHASLSVTIGRIYT